MEDEYLRERGADVRQVIERVLRVLAGTSAMLPDMSHVDGDEALIVVAHDISPADMLRLRGAASPPSSPTWAAPSHTAIVARSMGVPAVVALGNVRELVRDGDTLIIDGASGAVSESLAAHPAGIPPPPVRLCRRARRAEPAARRALGHAGRHRRGAARQYRTARGGRAGAGVRARHRPVPQRVPVHGPRGPAGRGRAVRSLCLGGEGNGGPSRHHPHAGHRRGQDAGRRGHGGHQPALGQRAIRYCLARPRCSPRNCAPSCAPRTGRCGC